MSFKKLFKTIAYITSIPLGNEDRDLEGLAKYLPWAGCFISAVLVAVAYLMMHSGQDPLLTGCLLGITWLLITGGLHMDGLMDTADGIYSHQSQERMLEIMQDSRVGNFGVLVGVSALIIKIVSLYVIGRCPIFLIPIMVIVPIAARWCELFAIGMFSYAKLEGKGKVWRETTTMPNDLIFGSLPLAIAAAAALFLIIAPNLILVVLLATLISGLLAAYWLNNKLGGHTGDTYGATVEISEVGGLLITALLMNYLVFNG